MQNQPYSDTTIDELRQIYLFRSLNDQQLAQIKENMRHIQIDEGNFLFKHGEHAARFFMLKKGHIKLLRLSREGAEKVFEVVSPGETFAEAAMFMPQSSYPMTAQAISDSSILCFENQIVIDILKESWTL